MRKLLLFFSMLSLIIPISYAQITFTGDVSVDFNNPLTVWAYDPGGENDVAISQQMQNAGKKTGWDIYRIGFYYDRTNDVMFIGWDFHGRICGDADGNGNPSTQNYLQSGKTDVANLGNGETITMWLDCNNFNYSGGGTDCVAPEVVIGVPKTLTASSYKVTYANDDYNHPESAYGDLIPDAAGSYLYNAPSGPTATKPDFECTINGFSHMPGMCLPDRLHDEVCFGIAVYSGSWSDGNVGYDKFVNSNWLTVTIPGVVIPPAPPANLIHNYPRDLYVLEGIPFDVPNGDPPVLFGPPFSNHPAGWPNWRVSRWDSEHQTYIRYGEPDYPVDLGLNPPPQQPGMGFWVVQDLVDSLQITVTGELHVSGDTVRIPMQKALPPSVSYPYGKYGQNQLANPFHIPVVWGNCKIQRADHSQPPMSIQQAFNAGISCHYSAVWDPYTKQYIVKDVTDSFAPWQGFWTCVFDSLHNYEILYIYPSSTDGGEGMTANAHPYLERTDALNEWSFFIGIVVDSLNLVDQCNYLGISPECSDLWDAKEAPEMAPMVSEGGYVHLYFPHTEWAPQSGNFCIDFRQGPFTGDKIWDFDIRSYQFAGDVLLTWDGAAQLSPEYTASLLDNAGNILVEDMSIADSVDVYPITIDANEIKHYQVKVTRNIIQVGDINQNRVASFSLSKAYPNPFNPNTSISFTLPVESSVKVSIYDSNGRLVRNIAEGLYSAGIHNLDINLSNSPSGLYFVKAEASGKVFGTEKITLLK